jgi:hypothetical protein
MLTRGETKRLLRQATQMRIRAEREVALASLPEPVRQAHLEVGRVDLQGRVEEDAARRRFSAVPSVFAFAEKLNSSYERPLWASHRYGAK